MEQLASYTPHSQLPSLTSSNKGPLPKLSGNASQGFAQEDICDQDFYTSEVDPAFGGFINEGPRHNLIVLPGAWAMGDGLVLSMEEDTPLSLSRASSSTAPSSSDPWNAESFGTRVARFAGSFSSSVSEYLADLTTAWTSDINTVDCGKEKATHHTLIDGEIAWIPGTRSFSVPREKKHK